MVVTMIVAVTAAAAVAVLVVMVVLAVNVAVRQFFRRRFTDSHDFNVEVQVLARQHVVTVNHHVIAVHFGDFNRNRTLIGISQETHANLQLVNAHENVFWYALHQVFIIVAVGFVSANVNVETIAHRVAFERFFQTCNQRTMPVQIVQRCTHRRLINQNTVFCTYLVSQADYRVFCYFHDISYRWILSAAPTCAGSNSNG
ncbi:hypothetical protein GGER_49100 [Serratia rubidaea]